MNKTMKKMLAGLLAVCCVPVAGMTAAAKDDLSYYWGTTTWNCLDGYERVENHGWGGPDAQVYVKELKTGELGIAVLHPREHVIRIVLREDLDADQAADEMVSVIETYFPGISATLNEQTFEVCHERYYHLETQDNTVGLSQIDYGITDAEIGRVFDFGVWNFPENAAEIEAGILSDLARRHLISEYYGWGGTADYSLSGGTKKTLMHEFGDEYTVWSLDENGKSVSTSMPIDWEGIAAYLNEHYPDCHIEEYESEPYKEYINYDVTEEFVWRTNTLRRITAPEEMTNQQYFQMGCELSGLFHVGPSVIFLESAEPTATGHNLLEKQGDVTLDTELSIIDVIALNKNLMTGEPICDTAKKNADINGNGTPDEADSLAILKEIIGLTEAFQPA